MIARLLTVSLAAAYLPVAIAQSESLDPLFAKYPVERWFSEREPVAPLKWSVSTSGPALSYHQRLGAGITVYLDGEEFSAARQAGDVQVLFQITDDTGARHQDHGTIEVSKLKGNLRSSKITCTQLAFLLPGDYRVSTALIFSATAEHFVKHIRLRVAPLKNESLRGAWTEMPKVEMLQRISAPDSYYFPFLSGILSVCAKPRLPTEIDLILNLTSLDSPSQLRGFLASAIPSLKALVHATFQNASINVAVLDLDRRQVAFEQKRIRVLNWERMASVLRTIEPGKIDVGSLGNDNRKAEFFTAEIQRRAATERAGAKRRIVIILTSAARLDKQVQQTHFASIPDCRVYYIRFTQPRVQYLADSFMSAEREWVDREDRGEQRTKGSVEGQLATGQTARRTRVYVRDSADIDMLVHSLTPFAPRVFDIASPEQFRKAFGTMLAEISRL